MNIKASYFFFLFFSKKHFIQHNPKCFNKRFKCDEFLKDSVYKEKEKISLMPLVILAKTKQNEINNWDFIYL